MKTTIRTVLMIVMSAFAGGAAAQATSFTYQGQLKDGVSLAEGQHDFRFRLFDSATGNAQLGTTQCVDNILVRDGVFTTTIDFGNQFASPNQRFIEIEVRRDTGLDCSNTTGYTKLTPRQPITPAPTATQAASAFSLASPDGSPAKAVFVDNNGLVGIGTTTPTHSVHIANTAPTLALQDTDSSGGSGGQQVGYLSYRDSANIERAWVGYGSPGDPDFSIINVRTGGDIVLSTFNNGGNVGIGTPSPAAKLDVQGDIKLGSTGQFFAPAGEEKLRIVRGVVSATGSILAGSGFSVTRNAQGDYTITFVSGFASLPAVTSVAERSGGSGLMMMTDGVTSTSARLVVLSKFDGSPSTYDAPFHFIAIGPR